MCRVSSFPEIWTPYRELISTRFFLVIFRDLILDNHLQNFISKTTSTIKCYFHQATWCNNHLTLATLAMFICVRTPNEFYLRLPPHNLLASAARMIWFCCAVLVYLRDNVLLARKLNLCCICNMEPCHKYATLLRRTFSHNEFSCKSHYPKC